MKIAFDEQRIPRNYQCPVCNAAMMEAYTLVPCTHKLCRTCAETTRTCPECHTPTQTKSKDHQFSALVEEAVKRQCRCTLCATEMSPAAKKLHYCTSAIKADVAAFTGIFPALAPELEALFMGHLNQGGAMAMDDSALCDMLLKASRKRIIGTVATWSNGKTGYIAPANGLADRSSNVFLHQATVLLGVVTVGCMVSFRTVPSNKGVGYRDALDVVVVKTTEQTTERVGRVTQWDPSSGVGTIEFIEGESPFNIPNDAAYRDLAAQLRVDVEVVVASPSGSFGRISADSIQAVPTNPPPPRADLSPIQVRQVLPASASTPPSARVTILWDYDQFTAIPNDHIAMYHASIVQLLRSEESALSPESITTIVVGNTTTFPNQSVTPDILRSISGVECHIVPTRKEAADFLIEAKTRLIHKNIGQTSTEVVLISTDQDFAHPVRRLESEKDIRVMWLHKAEPKAAHLEDVFRLHATKVKHWNELPCAVDRVNRTVSPQQARPQRQRVGAPQAL